METIKKTIYANNLPLVESALKVVAKRAKRLGLPLPVLTVGQPFVFMVSEDPVTGEKGSPVIKVEVELSHGIVKLPGWALVAALDHEEKLVRVVPEATLPTHYRGAEAVCDHCKTKRLRKTTYVLVNGAEHVQVGAQCVRDFLGHDAEKAVARGEFLLSLSEILEEAEETDRSYGSGGASYMDLREVLAATLAVVAKIGFVSVAKAVDGDKQSTKSAVLLYLGSSKDAAEFREYIGPEDYGKAELVIEWAKSLPEEQVAASDYLYNVKQIAENGVVSSKYIGVAASIPTAYARAMNELHEKATKPVSEYFGEIGKRAIFKLKVKKIIAFETQFGVTRLHLFVDEAGNEAKWFTGGGFQVTEDFAEYKATVKAHEEYKGVKGTILTRVVEK
jgi:hypothetical protein